MIEEILQKGQISDCKIQMLEDTKCLDIGIDIDRHRYRHRER